MKSIHTTLIAASLLLGLSGLALAQSAPDAKTNPAHKDRMHKMHAQMGERHGQHVADLKVKLQLDAGQEAAWSVFAQSMQAPMAKMAHPDRASLDPLSTPERIDQMRAHKAIRDADMHKRTEATKTFYAVLNAEQKKMFDAETAKTLRSMGHKEGHHTHH